MRRLISAALMCLCLATVSAPAQADDAVGAKAKYESGVRHFDLAEFEPALADFKEAYRNKPDPVFLYNIAQCHRKLGHADDAISFYQTYLRRAPDAKNHEEVERRLSELQAIRDAEHASITTSGKPQPSPAVQNQAMPEPFSNPFGAVAPTPPTPPAAPTAPSTVARSAATTPPAQTPSTSAALDFSSHDEATPSDGGSFYKRWWFWTAVGAVVAGTATVVIIIAERDPTKIPSSTLGSQGAMP